MVERADEARQVAGLYKGVVRFSSGVNGGELMLCADVSNGACALKVALLFRVGVQVEGWS